MSISPMSDIPVETDRNLTDQAVIVCICVHWGCAVHTEVEGIELRKVNAVCTFVCGFRPLWVC